MSQIIRLETEQATMMAATKDIRQYIERIVDESSLVEFNAFVVGSDRLDGAPIAGEGVLCGSATILGRPCVLIAQNAAALYGSFGKAHADKICRAFDLAAKRDIPVISVLDSAGARVGEGIEVLEAYGAVLQKAAKCLNQSGLHICVVKGQAYGLMAAYAALADVRVMQKDATMGVTSPTIGAAKTGSQNQTTAEANAKKGYVDCVCKDVDEVANTVQKLCKWFALGNSADDPNREDATLSADVSTARLVKAMVDDGEYIEYREQVAGAARCYMAHINNIPVGVVACDYTASAYLNAADLEKINDFAQLVTAVGIPFVTLVDSDGLDSTADGAAVNSMAYIADALSDARSPKIAVCVGHCIGAAYTLLASKGIGFDYSVAFADAVISPIAPLSAVHLMYADVLKEKGNSKEVQAKLAETYAAEHCDAMAAAAKGYIDEVIDPATLRPYVANALNMLGAAE